MIPNYPSKCINQKSNFLEVVSAPNQAQPELFSRHFQSFSIVFLRWVINFNKKVLTQEIDENFPKGPLHAHCSLSSALQPTFSVFSFLLRWLALLKTFFIGTSFKSNTLYIEHSFYRSLFYYLQPGFSETWTTGSWGSWGLSSAWRRRPPTPPWSRWTSGLSWRRPRRPRLPRGRGSLLGWDGRTGGWEKMCWGGGTSGMRKLWRVCRPN